MSSELPEEFEEKFENLVATAMAEMHIPGLSVALVKDDRIVYARGFGARNLKDNLPARPDTLYGVGSCTKSFTALAIMQLAGQGKLDVQDPVSKFLPFRLGSAEDPIRIHHLLSMSSGIPNLGVATLLISRAIGVEEKWIPMSSFDDLMLHVNGASEEIAGKPGGRYFYFNTGFTLLGEIVERVSKVPYEQYIKEKILKPLKMNRSTFLEGEFERDGDIMTPYRTQREKGEVEVIPTRHPFDKFIYAPGGLLSSVMELTRYLSMNMNGGVLEGATILDGALLDEMHKIHLDIKELRSYYGDYFGKMGYGYGWSIGEDFLGHKIVRHGGSTGVSSAQLMFVPGLKIGLAAAANVGQCPVPVLLGALAFMMGKDPEKEISDLEVERKLGILKGEYAGYKGTSKLSVVKKGPMLYAESKRWGTEVSHPLIPETDKIENFRFYVISGPGKRLPVEFVVDSSGRIDLYIERNRYRKIEGKATPPR